MNIRVESLDDKVIIHVSGDLTLVNSTEFRKELESQIAASGGKKLVLDLSEVRQIDSAGLGPLVAGLKQSRDKGVDFSLTGVKGKVKDVLEFTRLIKAFEIRPSVDQ
jgi:anti-sigma B factor antagonist